ncbi:MAG: hypothetical protein JWL62_2599 [Hyphomicrobiales bacterium]|nr:hypothetical protein [Hyphomicrobiales bacterium]
MRGLPLSTHALALMVWLSGPCPAAAQASSLQDDRGGNLRAYVTDVARLNRDQLEKRIGGLCASACTVYLGVKKVCVEPDAEVWFHAAFLPGSTKPDPTGSLEMLSYYPPNVRRWAIARGALEQIEWSTDHKLTGDQLIAMGLRRCPLP